MKMRSLPLTLLLTVCSAVELTVQTRTGTFLGNLNDTYPEVRQFKWVPYAKPPVGNRRWTSPERLDNDSTLYESTTFGPACSQYVSAVPSVWALNITGNLIVNYGESLLAGEVAQNSAEDCLGLAIWTPANATANSKLPVVIFTTGGGDQTGGINIPTQLPSDLVHNTGLIVVTINYRVNIFGYPNARGLNNSNFALQDQRAAVEWVVENIENFGGDSSQVTLWGQSAGSGLSDMYLFAYPEEPLIRASISSSATALGYPSKNVDYTGTNFTFVAKAMGCDFEDASLELQCMRRVPMPRLINFVGHYQDNSTLVNTSQPTLNFGRQPDDKYVFTDAQYLSKYASGDLAKVPKMIGTTAREGAPLLPWPANNVSGGPPLQSIIATTLNAFVCPSYNTSLQRDKAGLTTYRYEWAGNFSNIDGGVTWLGAYHYSDLYMFFGTYPIAPGPIPDFEVETSRTMQSMLSDFVRDPECLPQHGWPEYHPLAANGGELVRFGADEQTMQIVSGDSVAGACHIPGATYNTTP